MDERKRAIRYVNGLYTAYAERPAPRYYEAFRKNRLHHLGRDLEEMKAAGDEGLAIARRWCLVAGV